MSGGAIAMVIAAIVALLGGGAVAVVKWVQRLVRKGEDRGLEIGLNIAVAERNETKGQTSSAAATTPPKTLDGPSLLDRSRGKKGPPS